MLLISSITFINVFCFALLFLWATNRQTQIRPSKSQRRNSVPERKGKRKQISEQDKHDSEQDFLFSNDWGRKKSRENLLRSFSMDFDIEDEEDDDGYEDDDVMKKDDAKDTKDTNDYVNEVDISFGEDDKATRFPLNSQFQTMRQDIKQFITHMNLFSYLSDKAMKEALKYTSYIDLPREGSLITCNSSNLDESSSRLEGGKNLDGSLYIVIDGLVDCNCQLDKLGNAKMDDHQNSKMRFTAGPGDLITSQLAMVSDLIRLFQNNKDENEAKRIHPVEVRAITAAPNTRILCIPSIVYMKILEKFPNEVHQLTQTILGRTQRVTMQTLVKNFGLTDDIIAQKYGSWNGVSTEHGEDELNQQNKLNICQKNIQRKQNECDEESSVESDFRPIHVTEDTLQIAASLAASQLGTTRNEDINLIRNCSSVISIDPGNAFIQTGKKSHYLYFLIQGSLEIGNFIANISDKGLERAMRVPLGISIRDFKLNRLEKDNVSFQTAHTVTAGVVVGQLAAFTGEVSMVTIRVSPSNEGPAVMLQIPKSGFMQLVTANNTTFIQSIKSILQNDFSPVVHLLDWGLRWRDVNSGSILVHKGQTCQATYVVLHGRLRSGKKIDKDDQFIKEEHGRGSCIGEVQVLTGDIWPSDVYAIRDSELGKEVNKCL